jgi:putative aldouronate transport system permease protein
MAVTSHTSRDRAETLIIYAVLTFFALLAILPFINTIARSFSGEAPIIRGDVYVWPVNWNIDAYRRLIVGGAFWRGYENSVLITTVGTIVSMSMTMLCAYPLSRARLPGRGFFTLLVVIQLVFPPGLIPFYLTVRQVGLIDTYWSVILPYSINTFNMIVLMTYFRNLPAELEEAAVMDGANDIQVFWRIAIPLSVPVIMTLTLFYIVDYWNMFLPAIFFINNGDMQPVQVVLRQLIWSLQLQTQTASPNQYEHAAGVEALKSASVLVAAIPMLVVYPFIQRYFIKGIMVGAIKQ